MEITSQGAENGGQGPGYSVSDMAELEADLIEVAQALQDRYGEAGPTPDQEREFMREWLKSKGRSEEEVDAILDS